MKTYTITSLVAFVLCSFSARCQSYEIYKGDTINRSNEDGKRQGYWIFFSGDKEKITSKGEYVDNRKEGSWISYYENGNPQAEITYTQGRKRGPAKTYYKTGQLAEEGNWDANKWTGPYKAYHENGKIAYDWNYNDMGRKVGVQKYYYANGKLMIDSNWDQGKIIGILKEYHPDGSIRAERSFVDGKVDHTKTRMYEPKGQMAEATVDEREKDPEGENQIPKGNTATNEVKQISSGYFDGEGYHKLYKDTLLSREGEFREGKLYHGKKYFYDENNKLIQIIHYEEGKVVKNEKVGESRE